MGRVQLDTNHIDLISRLLSAQLFTFIDYYLAVVHSLILFICLTPVIRLYGSSGHSLVVLTTLVVSQIL
jgi:hypothetical protein